MNRVQDKGRTFSLDMSSDGAASLQKVILKKLTEFMGDYTDEVLAQYILVLVAHGKQQAQAAKDLEAFLGDQSESFVDWLWDYLCSNLHLHTAASKASLQNRGVLKPQREETNKAGVARGYEQREPEKLRKDPACTKHLPDLNAPPPKFRSSENESDSDRHAARERNGGDGYKSTAKRPHSPYDTPAHKERKMASDGKHHHHKRRESPVGANATRRLLQSAVREAVAPVAGLGKLGSKRLRSVVSTEADSLVAPQTISMHQACSEVDPIDDVRKGITPTAPDDAASASVWDRLGKRKDKKEKFLCEGDAYELRTDAERVEHVNTPVEARDEDKVKLAQRDRLATANRKTSNNFTLEERETGEASNVFTGGQHRVNAVNNGGSGDHMGGKHLGSSSNLVKQREGSANVRNRVEKKAEEVNKVLATSLSSSGQKHVVCSQGQASELPPSSHAGRVNNDGLNSVLEMKKRLAQIQTEMTKLRARQSGAAKETPNASLSSAFLRAEQDQNTQDSRERRTVFVTNIHFAATKEAISAHFAQCGKIEQVLVLTDGATGKPKGSAYVEFSAPDEAHKAIALNDTSFFSRILRVVLRDSIPAQEAAPAHLASVQISNSPVKVLAARGRFLRGSGYSLPMYPSMRGGSYLTPTKMQWKRDAASAGSLNSPVTNGTNKASPVGRSSFTYIRNPSAPVTNEGSVEGQNGAS